MRNIWRDNNTNLHASVWRYFKVDRLISSLDSSQLYFPAASQFGDPFEGATMVMKKEILALDERLHECDMLTNNAFRELCRLTKINCWHISEYESYLMWAYYAQDCKGVAIKTTIDKLLKSLCAYRLQENYEAENIYWGNVKYLDLHQERLSVGMLERFFYKHRVYESEKEFRVMISLRSAEEFGVNIPEEGISVSFDPKVLIENLYIGPQILDKKRKAIISICSEIGIEDRVINSSLLGYPWYV